MAQFHTDEYVDFLSRVTPDLVEAAAEGNGGTKTAGLAREMGRCESSSYIRRSRRSSMLTVFRPSVEHSQRRRRLSSLRRSVRILLNLGGRFDG